MCRRCLCTAALTVLALAALLGVCSVALAASAPALVHVAVLADQGDRLPRTLDRVTVRDFPVERSIRQTWP